MPDHEYRNAGKSRQILLLILFLLSLLSVKSSGFQQDSLLLLKKGSYLLIRDFKTFISSDTVIKVPASLVRVRESNSSPSMIFYDSLKTKASKSRLTRALFDLVVVAPDTSGSKKISKKSEESFQSYEGRRIRKIAIQRLNVFGAAISNPGLYNPNGFEKLLNSTHINTNESIIRKNLLFNEGDSVSSLTLSDNERLLRQLPFIDDARILLVPVSGEEADIVVITKDVYSLGADFTYRGKTMGSVHLFEKNIFGMGHEFRLEIPYSSESQDSPGIGIDYIITNIRKSFINLNIKYYNALDIKTYGIILQRKLVSSDTKYAGGISIRKNHTIEDLDTLPEPVPLRYTFQDYWVQRSFMLNRANVTRLIAGIRYINNNVYEKPVIAPDTYYYLQKYRLYLGSLTLSKQKYYKTNLIFSYGRTEDVPYGGMISVTAGIENNEFKNRSYIGTDAAIGTSVPSLGYIHISTAVGMFLNKGNMEQGVSEVRMHYFSNLLPLGNQMVRNFLTVGYTRGFDRYSDEYLKIIREDGFSGFRNDSVYGAQRVDISLETVMFNPANFYGFRFAVFGFADMRFLAGTNEVIADGRILSALGIGLRIRNDNLVFSTFQLRIGYFPSPPLYSRVSNFIISGEQLLRPGNFDPRAPELTPYR